MTKKTTISFIIFGLFLANFTIASVNINEIAWMGTETSASDEWIELYNSNASAINLEGWILKSVDGSPEIHLSGTILANGFYLLERTDDNTVPDISANQIYVGALKNSGEHLQLYDAQNNLQDSLDCNAGWFAGDNSSKQTMELSRSYPDQWTDSQSPGGTPKTKNSRPEELLPEESPEEPSLEKSTTTEKTEEVAPEIEESAPTTTEPITYPEGVLITEILPSPLGPDAEEEWIEIYNENAADTDISLWQITDTVGATKTYTFPEKTIIKGRGFLILYRPKSKITLNNQEDTLNLVQPDDNIIDTVTYEKAPRNWSYNRTIHGWKWSNVLTPGAMNVVPAPQKENIREDISNKTSTSTLTIEELAAIGRQIPKSSKPIKIFLIALFLAIVCTILIFILKKRLSQPSKPDQDNLHLPFKE